MNHGFPFVPGQDGGLIRRGNECGNAKLVSRGQQERRIERVVGERRNHCLSSGLCGATLLLIVQCYASPSPPFPVRVVRALLAREWWGGTGYTADCLHFPPRLLFFVLSCCGSCLLLLYTCSPDPASTSTMFCFDLLGEESASVKNIYLSQA